MLKINFLFLFCVIHILVKAQTFQAMPTPISNPISPETNPCFTGNGRTLLYEAGIGDNSRLIIAISYQKGGLWSTPEAVPGVSMKAETVYNGGHFISFEGNYIFFASNRHGGVGNNDLWYLEKTGNTWTPPANLGKPVNSAGAEADPALSPDGKFLYFVRYTDKKTSTGKPCGKIFVSERKGKDAFLEPKELPAPINSGCECNPRILADNSLTFASERSGGKGGYDQYKSEPKDDGSWSAPVKMDFINTAADDLYLSIPAGGDFIYLTGKAKAATDIVKTKIPHQLHPKSILFLSGNVTDAATKTQLSAKILLNKVKQNKQNYSGTFTGGAYSFFLPEQEQYEVTFSSRGYAFHTSIFNLDTLHKFKELRQDVSLMPLKINNVFTVEQIAFDGDVPQFTKGAFSGLNNLVKMLQENPGTSIEIGCHTDSIATDSILRPGLTETRTDTIGIPDSSGKVFTKTLYHNDRTKKEAALIYNFLIQKGISPSRLEHKGYGDSMPCNLNSQFPVKCLSRRTEIKVIKE